MDDTQSKSMHTLDGELINIENRRVSIFNFLKIIRDTKRLLCCFIRNSCEGLLALTAIANSASVLATEIINLNHRIIELDARLKKLEK